VATLELRPRSATEIVDAAFQILRANFVPLVTLSVAAQIPMLVIRIWFARNGVNFVTGGAAAMSQLVGSVFVFGILLVLLTVLAQCAITVAASQVYLGLAVDNGAAIGRGLQRFGYVVLTSILILLAVGVVFGIAAALTSFLPSAARVVLILVFVVVAIWLGLRLIPLNTVIVLEDAGPIEAIKRSLFLGESLVGHMFVSVLVGALIYIGIAILAGIAVAVLAAIVPAIKDPSVSQIFQTAFVALVYPLFIAVLVVLYYDLRIRREGFDVEMMSRAVPR